VGAWTVKHKCRAVAVPVRQTTTPESDRSRF
jgi:hypothetical protein